MCLARLGAAEACVLTAMQAARLKTVAIADFMTILLGLMDCQRGLVANSTSNFSVGGFPPGRIALAGSLVSQADDDQRPDMLR
jgi:hypothetical protein